MNNALKHSEAGEVMISMNFELARLRIMVEDDGVGFVPSEQLSDNHAYGIMGMETRIRDIGGTLSIFSQRGRGTKVEITL